MSFGSRCRRSRTPCSPANRAEGILAPRSAAIQKTHGSGSRVEHNAIGFDRVGVDRGRLPRLLAQPALPVVLSSLPSPHSYCPHLPPPFPSPPPLPRPVVVSTAPDLGGTLLVRIPSAAAATIFTPRRAQLRHSGARSRDSIRTSHRAPTQPLGSPRTAARDADGRRKRSGSLTPKSTTPLALVMKRETRPGARNLPMSCSGPRMPRRKIRGWIYRPHPRPLRPAPRSSSSRSPFMKAGIAPRPY